MWFEDPATPGKWLPLAQCYKMEILQRVVGEGQPWFICLYFFGSPDDQAAFGPFDTQQAATEAWLDIIGRREAIR